MMSGREIHDEQCRAEEALNRFEQMESKVKELERRIEILESDKKDRDRADFEAYDQGG